LIAHVVLRSKAGDDDLRAWLGRTLPSYMTPHRIVVRDELPLTPSGKIDRLTLARSAAPARPRSLPNRNASPLERTIAQIWRQALNSDVVPGLDENFFDAGGDSLRLLTVHSHVRQQLGANVSVTDLFEHSTIRKLAAFLSVPRGRT
jgi:aryl carrier-like protein